MFTTPSLPTLRTIPTPPTTYHQHHQYHQHYKHHHLRHHCLNQDFILTQPTPAPPKAPMSTTPPAPTPRTSSAAPTEHIIRTSTNTITHHHHHHRRHHTSSASESRRFRGNAGAARAGFRCWPQVEGHVEVFPAESRSPSWQLGLPSTAASQERSVLHARAPGSRAEPVQRGALARSRPHRT